MAGSQYMELRLYLWPRAARLENCYVESFNSKLRDELLDREWFLRKDVEGRPLEFKYVEGSSKGRKIHQLDDPEYKMQIIKMVI